MEGFLRFVHFILLVLVYFFATFYSLNRFQGRNIDISCKIFLWCGHIGRLVSHTPGFDGRQKDRKTFSLICDGCEGRLLPKLTQHLVDFYS